MRRIAGYILLFLLIFSYGIAVGRYQLFPFDEIRARWRTLFPLDDNVVVDVPDGRWFERRETPTPGPIDTANLEALSRLGYLAGYSSAPDDAGVIALDASRVQEGLTLFCSGHAPAVRLITTTGEVVHEWEVAFEDLWPEELPFEPTEEQKQFIRRARLLPSGDLLVVFEYIGIARLDRDSNVVWKNPGRNHHDFAVNDDGSIVTLVRREVSPEEVEQRYPGFDAPDGILDDQLVFLDSSGVELKRVSLFEALYRSEYALILKGLDLSPFRAASGAWDLLHANSVDVIENANPERESVFANGGVLVSLRNLNTIVSVDPEEGTVTWALSGKWRMQHQAQLLDNGNLLLLDNLGGNREAPLKLDRSRVLEVDPLTQEIVWEYAGSDESPLFTYFLGYVERLPNGNTLITESTQGRILEVTVDKQVVWEYLNPYRAGEDGELIASVMGALRVSSEGLTFLGH